MTRHDFAGGWYIDALPTGERCVLYPSSRIETHLGVVPLPPSQPFGVLFLAIAPDGRRFAGQAHDGLDPAAFEWTGTAWQGYPPPCCGVNPVIYDAAGVLHRSDCSIGSQGWRGLDDDGQLVTGDHSLSVTVAPGVLIHEYSTVDGLIIGQGHEGGLVVWDGTLRLLHPGACYNVRVHRLRDRVTVAFYSVAADGLSAHVYDLSIAELHALPEVGFTFTAFDHPVLIAPFAAKGSGAPDITAIGFYSEAVDPAEVLTMAAAAGTRLILVHDAATAWTVPAGLRPWDLPMLEIYRLADETLEASALRWHVQVVGLLAAWPGDVGLVPQFYGQGGVGPNELWSVAEALAGLTYLSALVNLSPRIKVVAPFSYDRLNGITAHPELRAAFDALLKATPGPPALLPIGRTPPPLPPQVLPPQVHPPQVHPPEFPLENPMTLPARCYILLHNGNIGTIAPGSTALDLAHVPQEYGAWQEVEVAKSKDWSPADPRVLVRFVAADRLVRVDKVLAAEQKYEQSVETWDPHAPDADTIWQQGIAAGPFVHYTSDSPDGQRHGSVYTVTCVDASGQLFQ